MSNLLLITIGFPLIGVALAALAAHWGRDAVRQSALMTSLITLVLAIVVVAHYPFGAAAGSSSIPYAASNLAWLGQDASLHGINIHFSVGLDGLSVWLFGLAALLTFCAVLVSWDSISDRPAGFYGLLLLLETGMLGVFAAGDIILFYVFFEFTLIPLFFLIGIWGSEERRYAATKFFLFTFAGSVLTFLGLLTIVLWQSMSSHKLTFSIAQLTVALAHNPLPNDAAHGYLQMLVFLALFAGFAIKVPLFPLHTWLPLAHTQAPAAGSVLLAGVLLKIGSYGFLRFSMPMLPAATAICVPWLLWLAVIGILYGALLALAQKDIKRLVACSSVSHMGFCMLGIFALNPLGLQGGVLQMINHGISTGALFALVGMLYDRYHTRNIADYGGIARKLPRFAFFLVLFTLSSIGLPGTNGFAGEFLILAGMFQRGWSQSPAGLNWELLTIAVLAVLGVVLGAWYMLWLVQRVLFGPLREPQPHAATESASGHESPAAAHQVVPAHHAPIRDLNFREMLTLAPLVVFVFWIGLVPNRFLQPIAPAVDPLAAPIDAAFQAHYAAASPSPQPSSLALRANIGDTLARSVSEDRPATSRTNFSGPSSHDSTLVGLVPSPSSLAPRPSTP
ncbi:MAG TPA: NADH-quinone oxidoreductase subunit M [Pirellulales bacterium]|nr:NADH-quinone oxidoreductase subunit M [Pirellulales bacterium]